MADVNSVVAKWRLAETEVQSIGAVTPPPPTGDPAWFLSRGLRTISNIGNAMATVDPCPGNRCVYSGVTKQAGYLNDTGMVLIAPCAAYPLGAIAFAAGGGHGDYSGNEAYILPLDAQLWARLTDPSTFIFDQNTAANNANPALYWKLYRADRANGELWVDADFDSYPTEGLKPTRQDQPSATHLFGFGVYLPPGFGNTDPRGALLTCSRQSLPTIGSAGGRRSHMLPLTPDANGKRAWSRFSANLMPSASFTGAFLDAKRRRIVAGGFTGLCIMDVDAKTWTALHTVPDIPSYLDSAVWTHCESLDVYTLLRMKDGLLVFHVVDPVTNKATKPGITGSIPTWPVVVGATTRNTHGGSTWSTSDDALWYYPGDGGRLAYRIAPTGDPRSTPWSLTAVPFTGDQPAVQFSPHQSYHSTRFLHAPWLSTPGRPSFLWVATTSSLSQFWRA